MPLSPRANIPVLIGLVPLFTVTSFTLDEGYRVTNLAGSRLAQLTAPSERKMTIQGTLVGRTRLVYRKGLEAMALTSRVLAAATAPTMFPAGLIVVSGFVISVDMQITDLQFIQNNKQYDAIDFTVKLTQVPRSNLSLIIGEAADLALAGGMAAYPTVSDMVPLSRQFGGSS
jgi:hypothetical protein